MKKQPAKPKKKPKAKLEKSKRPRSPRAVVKTIHHPPDAPDLAGSVERGMALRYRAMQLKIRGSNLVDIGKKLHQEFELVDIPGTSTVAYWINEAFAEGLAGQKAEAEAYAKLHQMRCEAIIEKLIPLALDDYKIERTKMQDGELVTFGSEDVIDERLKAAAEIRKQGESVMKALGITRPQAPGEQMNTEGMKMFIIQSIHNNIEKGGKIIDHSQAQTVLELRSGNDIIDGL